VDIRVLGMDVVNAVAVTADHFDRVAAHPYEMAGIVIEADGWTYGIAQAQEGRHVVYELGSMRIDASLAYAVVAGECRQPAPVGYGDVFPLIAQDVLGFRRPCGGYPVRHGIAGGARRQAGHEHDTRYLENLCQTNGIVHDLRLALAVDGV